MINQNQSNDDRASSSTDLYRGQSNPFPISQEHPEGQECIHIGQNGPRALTQHHKPFLAKLPHCLFLSCKQPHLLYFIIQSILEYFKYCRPQESGEIISTSLLLLLVIFTIVLEMFIKYRTYHNFTMRAHNKEEGKVLYETWNRERERWERTQMKDLREGQIIKVKRYLDLDPRLNPTLMLPIAYASRSKSILVKTTRIDKREQYKKVVILRPFHSMISLQSEFSLMRFNPELFDMKIDYRFISDLGETFEAELVTNGKDKKERIDSNEALSYQSNSQTIFSSEDIIPKGVGVTTEDFVVGVVLKQIGENYEKNLLKALSRNNNITNALTFYLKLTIVLNIGLMFASYVLNLALTATTTDIDNSYGEYSYCYFLNFLPIFMNTVYISMYMMLYVFRLVDQIRMREDVRVNFFNRSIDQLAQIDTLIMDDFFFLERPFNNDEFKFEFNQEAPLTEDMDLMLRVLQGGTVLREHMAGHVIPITKYFRLNRVKHKKSSRKVRIVKETVISEHCIEVKIKVEGKTDQFYAVRFNDHPVYSTISKLTKNKFKDDLMQMQRDYEMTRPLMLFIEIVSLDTDLSVSNQFFMLYGAITFTETFDAGIVSLLKEQQLVNRYNVVMLTTKTRWYIEYFMEKSKMKGVKDGVVVLDEKQEGQVNQVIKDHRNTIRKKSRESHQYTKSNILFVSSTMITYLSRRSIRKSLSKLSRLCKYVVFYGCSQFQKQICAVNLFKIFQNHLFMSNYQCDYSSFTWANLSISESGATSQRLTTFVIKKYDQLPKVLLEDAFRSLQVVQSVSSTHIFKNQFLLGANLMVFFLVFQGGATNITQAFIVEVFYFYNFIFTIAPLIYQFIVKGQQFIERDFGKYVNHYEMLFLTIKSFLFGLTSGFLAFSLVADEFVFNVFALVLLMSIVSANIFVLLMDNSKNKLGLVVCVILQILVSYFVIIMVQLFDTQIFSFIRTQINFDSSLKWFYISAFVILPFFVIVVLYVYSIGREITLIENNRQMSLLDYKEAPQQAFELTSEYNTEQVVRVFRGSGKGIKLQERKQEVVL